MSEISPTSSTAAAVSTEAQVKVSRKASEQLESVTALLLGGVQATPRPASAPTGQRLNIAA
jgi:hypothetical protein